jgi:hypothetical protein
VHGVFPVHHQVESVMHEEDPVRRKEDLGERQVESAFPMLDLARRQVASAFPEVDLARRRVASVDLARRRVASAFPRRRLPARSGPAGRSAGVSPAPGDPSERRRQFCATVSTTGRGASTPSRFLNQAASAG